MATDAWAVRGLCDQCRRGLYGGDERSETVRLFEPGPAPMAGQTDLFDPDR